MFISDCSSDKVTSWTPRNLDPGLHRVRLVGRFKSGRAPPVIALIYHLPVLCSRGVAGTWMGLCQAARYAFACSSRFEMGIRTDARQHSIMPALESSILCCKAISEEITSARALQTYAAMGESTWSYDVNEVIAPSCIWQGCGYRAVTESRPRHLWGVR